MSPPPQATVEATITPVSRASTSKAGMIRATVAALAVLALALAGGCASGGLTHDDGPAGSGGPNAPDATGISAPCAMSSPCVTAAGPEAASELAAIYIAVLRRYLTTGDHSFGEDHRFPVAYLLDTADTTAGNPTTAAPARLVPIPAADRAAILAGLADVGRVELVADRSSVIEERDHCAHVRGGGVLIILAPPVGDTYRVEVGIHGFVACLGATWFTYVVISDGTGWTVTGTAGPMAIA